ncbi:MAG: T9SS type A sorting domain-containing protein [Gemmatimonadetes bacterium]|jgi:enediyne biosynthesis protein E4|nr:T9SS type A sorting domain-containing protein [Gemmatimonadota bacterium]
MNSTTLRSWISRCPAIICVSLLLAGTGEAQTFFEDVTQEVGMKAVMTRSLAWGDYDNDGRPDIFLSHTDKNSQIKGGIALLHNEEDRFIDHTDRLRADTSPQLRGGGANFGDYDNDGDLDVFVPMGTWVQSLQNVLLRNDQGIFVDVAEEAGLIDKVPSDNAIWLDYDRDGYIDLYVGNIYDTIAGRNTLYRNNGDGTFSDATEEAGLNLQMTPESGGTNSGMVAGDYNDDGWPDLYLGHWGPNRLFLNDGKGRFEDRTTSDVSEDNGTWGVVAGDINNDGRIDLFQVSGWWNNYRSTLMLNLGEGEFLDITESVGLLAMSQEEDVFGVGLADIDNDGDLDLLTGTMETRSFLYLNNGDGTFVDQSPLLGYKRQGIIPAFGDYNLDGFLDLLWRGSGPVIPLGLHRNNGNDNHWLRVELVGVESNRNGIGARLIATAGDLRQTREMLGGLGYSLDEMVAHFGLGQAIQVDALEIRWPSGKVDVLSDIPADQKIRVIEGRGTFHAIEPTRWATTLSDIVVLDSKINLDLSVHPAQFEPDAVITEVTVDLSPFGGVERAPLEAIGDSSYRLRDMELSFEGDSDFRTLSVRIDQTTSLGPHWVELSKTIAVHPSGDLAILNGPLGPNWRIEQVKGIEAVDLEQKATVRHGTTAGAFQVRQPSRNQGWRMEFQSESPVGTLGFTAVRFAFHPGDAKGAFSSILNFAVRGEGTAVGMEWSIDLVSSGHVDLGKQAWQDVEIPLERFSLTGGVTSIRFSGNLEGTFYLDDIRLVTATSTPPEPTAITEDHTAALSLSITLDQNYPNPFNSDTVIRLALPTSGDVELSIFNLAGQQVATLVQGVREAGTYTVRWDGRDDDGRELASGVYLYRLRMGNGGQVETRKLLLLR